jgi:DinB family protein
MLRLRVAVPITLAAGLFAGASRVMAQAAPVPAAAQADAMPESYRQVQVRALELQRHALLAMADSMPERLYRDKVTPIQRDFAQQIMHAAGSFGFVIPMALGVPRPTLPDSAASLASRTALRAYINACYDWAGGILRGQSAADRARTVNLFGQQMPAWQVWDEMHQHTFWTAGQIVANFRKNGMAPPGFGFF